MSDECPSAVHHSWRWSAAPVRLWNAPAGPAPLVVRRAVALDRPADVPGRLYDSGFGWPVAVFDDGPTLVREADRPGRSRLVGALRILDDVEATATDLMARIEVATSVDARGAYTCVGSTAGMTSIARWMSADERWRGRRLTASIAANQAVSPR